MGGKKRRFGVPSRAMDKLFQGGLRVLNGLPDDTRIDDCYWDGARDQFFFVLESEDFEHVGEGEVIPLLDPEQEGYKPYRIKVMNELQ